MKEARYAAAGVDIDAGNRMVELIKPLVRATARAGAEAEIGGFGGLFDLKAAGLSDPILVAATDGVGTKVKIAVETSRHDTIGIDLVAMSVNDLVVQGCRAAVLPGLLRLQQARPGGRRDGGQRNCRRMQRSALRIDRRRDRGNARHVSEPATTTLPVLPWARWAQDLLPRNDIAPGDVVIGLASSGVHANGFSLVRRIVAGTGLSWDAPAPFDPARSLGEALLTPTRLYVRSCLAAIRDTKAVKALAHITGGGFVDNIPRVSAEGAFRGRGLDQVPVLPVFKWLAAKGDVSEQEMLRTFNCGVGMIAVLDPGAAAAASEQLRGSRRDRRATWARWSPAKASHASNSVEVSTCPGRRIFRARSASLC